ncbi:response regulator [Sphingosinicellaceae bacterium]|nr:response regulator [Sphingosinicellaceae bacterium]
MLVEDDPAVRRSLCMLFQSRGYVVRAHASAKTLVADPELGDAACLVADYRLGDDDGVALLRTLRRRGWLAPAILVTGHNSPEITAQALAAGFSTVIEKPLREGFLVGVITQLVAQSPAPAFTVT